MITLLQLKLKKVAIEVHFDSFTQLKLQDEPQPVLKNKPEIWKILELLNLTCLQAGIDLEFIIRHLSLLYANCSMLIELCNLLIFIYFFKFYF
jgi:hypothetical protein